MKFNPMITEHKMCLTKRRFATVEEAKEAAGARKDKRLKLYAYECPFCHGLHLTKHARPLDPSLKDRVNIEM